MAAASAAGSPGGTSRPLTSWLTRAGIPPTWLAMTGSPAAIASISTEGSSSYRVARTSTSICRSTAGIRACGAKPANRTGAHDEQAGRLGDPAERADQRADILLRGDPADIADPRPSQVRKWIGCVCGEQVRVIARRDHPDPAFRDSLACQA